MRFSSTGKWAVAPKFDLTFFILPFLIGILYFFLVSQAPQYAFALTVLVWTLFAQAHFGSTWFIYADKKNRAHYRTRPATYYLVPILIFLAALVLGRSHFPLLLIIVSVASLYHVSKQSVGILQIYRARNKEFDPLERRVELFTVFGWALFSAGYGALRLPDFQKAFAPLLGWGEAAVALLFGLSLGGTLFVVLRMIERPENSLPKTAFLGVSFLTYTPYLYATPLMIETRVFEIATLTGLIGHYMQYMGLVWLINRNKYRPETDYGRENPFLRGISSRKSTIIATIFSYAALMAALYWAVPAFHAASLFATLAPSVVCGLMLIHFYIDSFIWRFRDPFIKETVAPFLRAV